MTSHATLALLMLLPHTVAAPPPAVEPLTLAQCIDLALRRSPEVAAATSEIEAADASRKSSRGQWFPRLRLDANLTRWDDALVSRFEVPGAPVTPEFVTREAFTWGTALSLFQPLSSLWSVAEGQRLKELGVDVASIRRDLARRDLAFQVTEAWFRVLQAETLLVVAEASVKQLEAQVQRTEAFRKGGILGENDVLRARVGLANAVQRRIQASGQASLARSRLAIVIGLDPSAPLAVAPVSVDRPPAPGPIERSEDAASVDRLELREAEARIEQGRAGLAAAWSRLAPQVSAVAQFQHNEGSAFQQEDAFFVGLTISWDVWDWGQTYYATAEADARIRQALAARDRLRDGLRLEVRHANVALESALQALGTAEHAVASAEENHRLEQKRYDANASTTFDVLDAEQQLTSARAQREIARFDAWIAHAALVRATGRVPGPGTIPIEKDPTQ